MCKILMLTKLESRRKWMSIYTSVVNDRNQVYSNFFIHLIIYFRLYFEYSHNFGTSLVYIKVKVILLVLIGIACLNNFD